MGVIAVRRDMVLAYGAGPGWLEVVDSGRFGGCTVCTREDGALWCKFIVSDMRLCTPGRGFYWNSSWISSSSRVAGFHNTHFSRLMSACCTAPGSTGILRQEYVIHGQ